MLRTFARVTGLVLLAVGLAGLSVLPKLSAVESFFHLAVGALFVYLGLWQRDPVVVRRVVGGMGVLLLLSKGAVVTVTLLVGGEEPLFGPVEVVCFAIGLLSVLIARLGKDGASGPD